jgi:hypothetical protein
MNSRDAAYDEEELLRRAIEESKEDNKSGTEETAPRRGKRSRSDSEVYVLPLLYSLCNWVTRTTRRLTKNPFVQEQTRSQETTHKLAFSIISLKTEQLCISASV